MNTTPIYYNLNAVYIYIYLIFCKLWLESTQQNWLEFVIYNFFILPRFIPASNKFSCIIFFVTIILDHQIKLWTREKSSMKPCSLWQSESEWKL